MKRDLLLGLGSLAILSMAGTSAFAQAVQGPTSSQTPYVIPTATGVKTTSIITVGDMAGGYACAGLLDGTGAFDNGDGTFTMVIGHEMGNTQGAVHAHGQAGAFVSKWVIKKSDLSVVSGGDLIQKVFLWNTTTNSYVAYNAASTSSLTAFNRFCSADLPAVSAFYNSKTGKGTQARIFMNGEESGSEGRGMAHVITGAEAGNSYELPYLGKFSWENSVACPYESDSTIVIGTDDATPGQVYLYIGVKQANGNEIERAGLHGGTLYGIKVNGLVTETSGSVPAPNTAFTLASLGKVQNLTGSTLNTNSNNIGITNFLRPEDGAWDPSNPNDFYFVTTNAFGSPSRMWRLRFTDISKPSLGGTITAVLDGTEGQEMMDNMGIDNYGHIMIQEDVGGNARLGKTWLYTIATDVLKEVSAHDPSRFLSGGANYLGTVDEEASGVIDAQAILGAGWWLEVDQAHYNISGALVQGGQIYAEFIPDTYNANPEINLTGNGASISNNDVTPSTTDNTSFGNTNKTVALTKSFTIKNAGPGKLTVTGINFTGTHAADFAMTSPIVFPKTVNANDSVIVFVTFTPPVIGVRNATLNIMSNDFDERTYKVSLTGTGVAPKISVEGNSVVIMDGDLTAGGSNNTDFGTVNLTASENKSFGIRNTGTGPLTITGVTFSGANASEFKLITAPTFPVTLAPAASQSITVQFTPTAVGTRSAVINIANDDADNITYDFALEGNGFDPTGVSNVNALISSVKLFPNPTGNEATIALAVKKAETFSISVSDIQGKQVIKPFEKALSAGEQQFTLNTTDLANGIYFVQVAAGNDVTRIKMVVAH